MRNETSQSWYFMPLSILLSSLAAKDIRDNLFLGLFIEGVECLPCAAIPGLPFGGVASMPRFCGAAFRHRVGANLRVGVLSRKSRNPAVLRPTECNTMLQSVCPSGARTRRIKGKHMDRCEDLNCCLLSYLPLSAVLQCGEKNTLVKAEIAIALKASPNIRTAWQPQRSLLVHDVHESLSDHVFA